MDEDERSGDDKFREYLSNFSSGTSKENYQRDLLFDILKLKMETQASVIESISSYSVKPSIEKNMKYMMDSYKKSLVQLDYFLSFVIDELDNEVE